MAGRTKPKKRRRTTKPDNPAQSKRFIESARKLGLGGSSEDFERALEAVVKPKKREK